MPPVAYVLAFCGVAIACVACADGSKVAKMTTKKHEGYCYWEATGRPHLCPRKQCKCGKVTKGKKK